MARSISENHFQTSTGCDAAPKRAIESLGGAAETASDIATELSGKDVLAHTVSGGIAMTETESPTLDPVCGMSVDERNALHFERDGEAFFFCSDRCRKAFLATIAGVKSDCKAGSCCG